MKGSLDFQRSVEQPGNDVTFQVQARKLKHQDSIHAFSMKNEAKKKKKKKEKTVLAETQLTSKFKNGEIIS